MPPGFSADIDPPTQNRLNSYLSEVLRASGDPQIVEALRAQLDETLSTTPPDVVLDALEPACSFEPCGFELDPVEAPPFASWVAPATLVGGLVASFVAGGVFGDEAGGSAMLLTFVASLTVGWFDRERALGRATVAATLAMTTLILLILVLEG